MAVNPSVTAQDIQAGGNVTLIAAQTAITYASGARLERLFATVPPPGPHLIGREPDLADLRARLAQGGPLARVAIRGLPGAGKTALALALAYDQATLERFSGGVLWAGLGPHANPDASLNAWSTALGLDLADLTSPAERAQRLNLHLQTALGSRPFLLVLDDAWRWEDVAPFQQHFTSPGSALLLTTRDEVLARRFAGVPPLTLHELSEEHAVDLLARACPEAQAADPAGLEELARAVGGLPLALVLMGAELAALAGQPRWVRAALDRLHSAGERLALHEDQPRAGLNGAPLTLQAVIELSLDALPDEATRAAFAELAVFAPKPADFSREAALAVWGVDDQVSDERLQAVCRLALLETAGEDRFTLHQVLAAVAGLHLPNRPAVAARHLAFYRTFVDRDREAWRLIEPELPQIRQALAWASATPGRESDLIDLVWSMRLFMLRRGFGSEQLAWYDHALRAARILHRSADEATILNNIGMVHGQRGALAAALENFGQALPIWRQIGDWAGVASTLNNIGGVNHARGELDQALENFGQALSIRQQIGDWAGVATTLNNIGALLGDQGEPAAALEYYEQALPIWKQIGDWAGVAAALNNIGEVHRARGELDKALENFGQALPISREVGDRAGEAATLSNIGLIHHARGELAEAIAALEPAVTLMEAIQHPELDATREALQALRKRLAQ